MPRISHCWIVNTIYNEQSHWLGPCSEYCVFYIQMASIDFVTRTKLDYKQTDELWSTGSLMDAIKLSQISDNYSCTSQCLWRWNTFHPFPGVLIGLRLKTKFQTPLLSCTFYSLHYGAPSLASALLCVYRRVDMIVATCQLQEKCLEQHRDLYTTFVDLPKAFDTVSRDGLCKIMSKFGCPTNSSLSFASSWRACEPKSLMMMNCQILSQSPTAQARLCPCPYSVKLDVLCYAERCF